MPNMSLISKNVSSDKPMPPAGVQDLPYPPVRITADLMPPSNSTKGMTVLVPPWTC